MLLHIEGLPMVRATAVRGRLAAEVVDEIALPGLCSVVEAMDTFTDAQLPSGRFGGAC